MNTLDVCCALIELPAARGPLLLGAKKKTGQSRSEEHTSELQSQR